MLDDAMIAPLPESISLLAAFAGGVPGDLGHTRSALHQRKAARRGASSGDAVAVLLQRERGAQSQEQLAKRHPFLVSEFTSAIGGM
jgi:hypothetical protein